jgi:neutral trehalase
LKKISLQYQFLKAELEEIHFDREEYLDKFDEEFSLELEFIKSQEDKTKEDCESTPTSRSIEINERGLEILKSIHRKIVKLFHPDKTKNPSQIQIFHEAQTLYEEKNLPEMIGLAARLSINIKELIEEDEIIINQTEREVEILSSRISKIKNSLGWKWHNAKNDEEKNQIKELCYIVWGINKEDISNYIKNKKEDT